jgi:hypothetical protein
VPDPGRLRHYLVGHKQIRASGEFDVEIFTSNDLHPVAGVLGDQIRVVTDTVVLVGDGGSVGLLKELPSEDLGRLPQPAVCPIQRSRDELLVIDELELNDGGVPSIAAPN